MYNSKAKVNWYEVDGHVVFLDSKSEAIFMRRLVKNGFSGKWRRPGGVAYGSNQYTPDFELSVEWQGKTKRAHIEYKSTSATQFSIEDRERALAALHYYDPSPLLLLYIGKTKRWYVIDPATKYAKSCPPPKPSGYSISTHAPSKKGISVANKFGRRYKSSTGAYVGAKVADGLEGGLHLIFGSPKKGRGRKR